LPSLWHPGQTSRIDHALETSICSGILVNSGHLLENLVFTALHRVTPDIFYYKTKTGPGVDFIAGRQGQSLTLDPPCG
jgi:uncharacterized protein